MKVSHIVAFAAGACVGGSAVYIFLREKIKASVEKGNRELLDAIQQSMEDRYAAMYTRKEEEDKEKKDESRPDTRPKTSIQKPTPGVSAVKTSYSKIMTEAKDILKEYEEEPEWNEEKPKPKMEVSTGPYMMCYEDMMEQDKGYDLIKCHFYADDEDGIVTDDYGTPIEDAVNAIGWDNLKYLRDVDRDMIYVRNDGLNVDYELYLSTP